MNRGKVPLLYPKYFPPFFSYFWTSQRAASISILDFHDLFPPISNYLFFQGQLVNLERLRLQNNKILEVPEELGCLRKLEELNLSNNKYLKTLPKSIGELRWLLVLDLHDCQLVIISFLSFFILASQNKRKMIFSSSAFLFYLPSFSFHFSFFFDEDFDQMIHFFTFFFFF